LEATAMKRLLSVPVILALTVTASAGEFNEKLKIGDPAPAWTNLPGVDGSRHSLADLKDQRVVVLVFTCNSCPVAAGYEDRIIAFAKKHAGPEIAVVAVNVNTIEADRLDKMQERAKEKAFPYPYLYDETQKIAKDYGATSTPEFFVLDRDRGIAYMGAMDDVNPPRAESKHYLEDAVQAVLAGQKPAPAETRPRGCSIRFLKPKR
jgi:peroxiredoxin